ncbi:hypothetical protein AAVH_21134 [Aphelenchoides avenae]|nr:hypothetical protein AAVH_21134 [Aphelenchus avenae]
MARCQWSADSQRGSSRRVKDMLSAVRTTTQEQDLDGCPRAAVPRELSTRAEFDVIRDEAATRKELKEYKTEGGEGGWLSLG